jgi:hypothetical protein
VPINTTPATVVMSPLVPSRVANIISQAANGQAHVHQGVRAADMPSPAALDQASMADGSRASSTLGVVQTRLFASVESHASFALTSRHSHDADSDAAIRAAKARILNHDHADLEEMQQVRGHADDTAAAAGAFFMVPRAL